MQTATETHSARALEQFALFNERGGKFRIAVVNICNLDCFFCHNEAMPNPRSPAQSGACRPQRRIGDEQLLGIINAYTALGGRQVNITGGEPLAHSDIVGFLRAIEARQTQIVLNTNAVLAQRLLKVPPIPSLSAILASLHTVDDGKFRRQLGGRSAKQVMQNIVALSQHGYAVQINYSLGAYNQAEFETVLEFSIAHQIPLKAIAFVRPNDEPQFYRGKWIDPRWLAQVLGRRGARKVAQKEGFGGRTTQFELQGVGIKLKNIARGRLRTDFCDGCAQEHLCGEGIYALRGGVDGWWKQCLLRQERFEPIRADQSYQAQILSLIGRMVGDWSRSRFETGAPL